MFWDGVNLVYSPNPPKIKETHQRNQRKKNLRSSVKIKFSKQK